MKDVGDYMITFAEVKTNKKCPNEYLDTLPVALLLMGSAEQHLWRALKSTPLFDSPRHLRKLIQKEENNRYCMHHFLY